MDPKQVMEVVKEQPGRLLTTPLAPLRVTSCQEDYSFDVERLLHVHTTQRCRNTRIDQAVDIIELVAVCLRTLPAFCFLLGRRPKPYNILGIFGRVSSTSALKMLSRRCLDRPCHELAASKPGFVGYELLQRGHTSVRKPQRYPSTHRNLLGTGFKVGNGSCPTLSVVFSHIIPE